MIRAIIVVAALALACGCCAGCCGNGFEIDAREGTVRAGPIHTPPSNKATKAKADK